jgi:hypothetical protein
LAITGAGSALAASSMPGAISDTTTNDISLVEALYPAVMNNDEDPFSTEKNDKFWLLAQADTGEASTDEGPSQEVSPECAAFAANPNADIGEIMRAGCQPSLAQMSALMDNPLGNVAMLFTQFDFYQKQDPGTDRTDMSFNYMGIFQFPKKLGSNWNLINRMIWNVPSMPLDQDKIDSGYGGGPGGEILPPPPGSPMLPIDLFHGRTTGFGDMIYDGLFSPANPKKLKGGGIFAWGAGFDLMLPTATDDILGTGKWSAGPSLLGVYMGPKWKVGALLTHFKDFAGSSNRNDVNLSNIQYFTFYSLSDTFSIGAAPNIICNWEQSSGDECSVPIGLGFASTVNIGKVPVRFGAEVHYTIIKPDHVLYTEWDFRFYIIPAAPSALFKWMN